MINYHIRPGDTFVKIDTDTQIIDLVLNAPKQQTLSTIQNNQQYYDMTIQQAATWPTTDQATYESNRTAVLQFLSNR